MADNAPQTVDVDTKFIQRLHSLPGELRLNIWEWVLHPPRVININFRCGRAPDMRWTWHFNRDQVKRLTYPALLLDNHNKTSFERITDFNRVIKVNDGQYSIKLELSLDRDIFFFQGFHRGRVFRSPSAVDADSPQMLQLKKIRRVMVLSDELIEIFSVVGYPDYTWCEAHLFGPIGHRDSQVEDYIVLLDRPQTVDNYIRYDDLLLFSEYELLTILSSSPTDYGWAAARDHPNLETHVRRILGAWNYWSQRGHIRLPNLVFARLKQHLSVDLEVGSNGWWYPGREDSVEGSRAA